MMSESLPLAINLNKLSMYSLAPDEVVFFEWLLFKQSYFGASYFFYYSRRKIEEVTRIKRARLESIVKMFEDMGFLKTKLGFETVSNNQALYYNVDFKILAKDDCLCRIVDKDSVLYKDLKAWLKTRK